MNYPYSQLSRLRGHETFRRMVRENSLSLDDLIQPLFVHHGEKVKNEIPSMPGQYQMSLDYLVEHTKKLFDLGIRAVLLFGIPAYKDAVGSDTWNDKNGVVQQALWGLRKAVPEMILITDACFCEYTDHGHCGVLIERDGKKVLDHEATLNNLALQAVSHANAGADMIAPSGMIDAAVGTIRETLDGAGYNHIPIMSYSAKYASSFYEPFRDAADGAPRFGDRKSHQLDPANSDEALREVEADIEEEADIVMVKPALAYMDIIRQVKDTFNIPVAAYNVSGEYAMVKAASAQGWLDEKAVVMEILTGLKRAGADLIISYHANDVAMWLSRS
ncbi:MAG: porphobilinogen synthase [Sedimentisphaerales bacterium]|nr:porphobilinogen synthase [Sedimentisphaerales bacterium]